MNEPPTEQYDDEIYNKLVHPFLDPNNPQDQSTLDREVYSRFCELIIISMDYVFGYAYEKGKNNCQADRGSLIALRSIAVMVALSGRSGSSNIKQVIQLLNMNGVTERKLLRYIRRYKQVIQNEYGDVIKKKGSSE